MLIRLIITYILNIIDLFCTNHWVKKYGIETEANPFGKLLYQYGLVYVFKIGIVGLLLFALYKGISKHPEWNWTSWLVLGVYTIILIVHIALFIKTKGTSE